MRMLAGSTSVLPTRKLEAQKHSGLHELEEIRGDLRYR